MKDENKDTLFHKERFLQDLNRDVQGIRKRLENLEKDSTGYKYDMASPGFETDDFK